MKKIISFILIIPIIFSFSFSALAGSLSEQEICAVASGIAEYKRNGKETMFSGSFLESAGSTAGDWYPLGLSLFGFNEDYKAFLSALRDNVRERYESDEKLSSDKATEWHRIIISSLACGADPENFCVTKSGDTINLLADGVYYRKNIARQGINGYIWGLIALNTRNYAEPKDAVNTKDSILSELLSRQLENGGWSMTKAADTDITAMALIALSPFYGKNDEVTAAADKALSLLSDIQLENGGYAQSGIENSESCAEVITALCSLGIDPENDKRFIKNGLSPVDALLSYRLNNGSFTHSFVYDKENPSAVCGEANDMSCQQALIALGALYKMKTGGDTVFDFSAASVNSDGFDSVPKEPGAAQKALETLNVFFSDADKRKVFVSAALLIVIAVLVLSFIKRRKKKKQ
ncbi:MAG: hypothetical protein J1E34_00670 [Oscillospiraceae bacterium]|nr:hypothetical protein [Oscillospiraceae bacterium]